MPVNEILAPSYARIKWSSPVAVHNSVLYFGSTADETQTVNPPDVEIIGRSSTPIAVSVVVGDLFSRARSAGVPVVSVDEILVFNSANGANVFVGTARNPELTGSVGTYVAAAYIMWVFAASNRQQTRFTGFESPTPAPQRNAGGAVPQADNGTVQWYFLRGAGDLRTQDGAPITQFKSTNTGYNRKLARSYGRRIAP